jgi:hypothetical protein
MTRIASRISRSMTVSIPFRLAFALIVLAGLTANLDASAADKAAASAAAPRTPILTPAQLKECVARKERLHAQTDDALKDKAAIEADKAEIARSGTSLGDELATLDKTSEAAVEAYNVKVEQRDKLIDGYQARVSAYNGKADTVRATREAYEKSCENRRYDERDLNDLTRSKKQ